MDFVRPLSKQIFNSFYYSLYSPIPRPKSASEEAGNFAANLVNTAFVTLPKCYAANNVFARWQFYVATQQDLSKIFSFLKFYPPMSLQKMKTLFPFLKREFIERSPFLPIGLVVFIAAVGGGYTSPAIEIIADIVSAVFAVGLISVGKRLEGATILAFLGVQVLHRWGFLPENTGLAMACLGYVAGVVASKNMYQVAWQISILVSIFAIRHLGCWGAEKLKAIADKMPEGPGTTETAYIYKAYSVFLKKAILGINYSEIKKT